MKRILIFPALVLAATLAAARAENVDDQYVHIYNLVQQADALNGAGQPALALARYGEAQGALQTFRAAHPNWNPKVVAFRLTYLDAKIFSLKGKVPATPAPVAPKPAPTGAAPAPAPPANNEPLVAALQADVRQLQAEKSTLEFKLKEALATRPVSVDPREFAKSQEQVRSLLKENDLLKAGLEKERAKAAVPVAAGSPEETRRALAEATRKLADETARANALAADKKNLQTRLEGLATSGDLAARLEAARKSVDELTRKAAEQSERATKLEAENNALVLQVKSYRASADAAEALRSENSLLKKQLAAKPASGTGDTEAARQLKQAEARIAALQSEADILRLEKIGLENKVRVLGGQTPVRPVVASTVIPPASRTEDLARIKQLEKERDDLVKKLDAANKQVYGSKGKSVAAKVEELNSQITGLRSRLEVFEARAVPFTAEELALFKKPETQLANADPNAGRVSVKELPSGAAQLAVSAQKHFAARQFEEAEKEYLQILRRDEKNVYTLANLAAIQLEAGRLDDAEKHVKQALAVAPDDAYSLSILGYVKFRQEKYDDALDALSRAAKLNPQSAEIQNYLGVTLGHKGMRDEAEKALRRAIQLDPGYGSAHNNLAVIYATAQKPSLELARWHYQRALAAGHPKNDELEKALDRKTASASTQ